METLTIDNHICILLTKNTNEAGLLLVEINTVADALGIDPNSRDFIVKYPRLADLRYSLRKGLGL